MNKKDNGNNKRQNEWYFLQKMIDKWIPLIYNRNVEGEKNEKRRKEAFTILRY